MFCRSWRGIFISDSKISTFLTEYPAKVLHCGKKMSAEKLKDFLDEKTDLLKNAYW